MQTKSENPRKLLLGILVSMSACFVVQAYLYFSLNAGTGKGESNYFSTMSRFQAAASPAAEIAFAGSSITGRLPGRESGNQEIANLGSDGGPALDGMRLIALGQIDAPQWLVIETNTMYGGVGFGDALIVKGAQGPWFDVGANLPLLGASARPSAMMYAQLLRRPKIAEGKTYAVELDKIDYQDGDPLNEFTESEKKRFDDYVAILQQLQQLGVKILMVTYPAGDMKEREVFMMQATVSEIAKRFPIKYLNLERQIPRKELEFTDSVHLSPLSAANTLATIYAVIHDQQ